MPFPEMIDAMIAGNTSAVDTKSGATIASQALIDAVNDTLSQVK